MIKADKKKAKIESVSWKELRRRLVTKRGRELIEKIIDHLRYSQTKVWLILKEGEIFVIKDAIKGFMLHNTYSEGVFTFRDHRNQEQEIHEDEIIDVNGF